MIGGAAGDHADVSFVEDCFHGFGVFEDLLGVLLELWFEGFSETDGFAGDLVHVGAALESWEYGFVYFLSYFFVLSSEDHAASWASKGFVGGGEDDVESVIKRIFDGFSGNQSGNVGHVGDGEGADFLGDFYKFCVVEFSWVGGESSENNFWFFSFGDGHHFFIVNFSCFDILHFVSYEVEDFGNVGNGMSMGEVSSVAEVHAHDGFAWFEEGKVGGDVGGGSRERLDVGVLTVEELASAFFGNVFDGVGVFLTSIISSAWVPF